MYLEKVSNLSDKKINSIIGNVKGTLAVEDMFLQDREIEILRTYLKGKCTENEMISMMKKI